MVKVGDPVKYIGKQDICCSGTWVLRGKTYIVEWVNGTTIRLKDKWGTYSASEFESSTMDLVAADAYEEDLEYTKSLLRSINGYIML